MFRKLALLHDGNVEDLTEGEYASIGDWHQDHADLDTPLNVYVGLDESLITAKALSEIMMSAMTFDIAPRPVWAYIHSTEWGYECSMEFLLVTIIDGGDTTYISEHLYETLAVTDDPEYDISWTVVPGVVM